MVKVVFIRFVSGEIHECSHVSTGLFQTAFELMYDPLLPDDEYDLLRDLMDWFNEYLKGPSEYRLRAAWRLEQAISWFKPTAHKHLSRAWEMASILERNGVLIRMIKAKRTGYVLYEDEAQVFAEPFADIRRVL
jgi:hypothetical protein